MLDFPKLVFLIVVFAAIWIGYRWLLGPRRELPRQQSRQSPPRAIPAEDLVACDVCRAYVADEAQACGRPDCPRPR